MLHPPTRSTLFPYTTLFRSLRFNPVEGEARNRSQVYRVTAAGGLEAVEVVPGLSDGAYTAVTPAPGEKRSEEHTSELQSQSNLVCRLLLEKKKGTTSLPASF